MGHWPHSSLQNGLRSILVMVISKVAVAIRRPMIEVAKSYEGHRTEVSRMAKGGKDFL